MLEFLLTMCVAAVVGLVFKKIHVPGGLMIGAIVGVAALNILWGVAYMPYEGKLAAQMISGAFIGVGISREELKSFGKLLKPMSILVGGMLVLNITMGFLLYAISDMSLLTCFFAAVPGGMSDTPIIAAEMGADGATVALLQFVRLCAGVGVFPMFIQYCGRHESDVDKGEMTISKTAYSHGGFALTMGVAVLGGVLGKLSGVPSGTLLFALIFTIVAKQLVNGCMLPLWVRKCAQLLAGAYIGTSVNQEDVRNMGSLIVPALVLVAGYFVTCMVIGRLLKKHCRFKLKEGMLCATPAGAADMALISADIGVTSPDVVVLQIARMLFAITVFPQVIYAITMLCAGLG